MALTNADFNELMTIRRNLDVLAFELTLIKAQRIGAKAYNREQPRVGPGHGRESGRWTDGDAERISGEGDRRREHGDRMTFLAPYLVETYNMGPRTLCTYQGWPASNRFAVDFPRGPCPPNYFPEYGPI